LYAKEFFKGFCDVLRELWRFEVKEQREVTISYDELWLFIQLHTIDYILESDLELLDLQLRSSYN
jgi:hypothetical protein